MDKNFSSNFLVHHNLFTFGNSDTDTDIIAENTKFMDRKFF